MKCARCSTPAQTYCLDEGGFLCTLCIFKDKKDPDIRNTGGVCEPCFKHIELNRGPRNLMGPLATARGAAQLVTKLATQLSTKRKRVYSPAHRYLAKVLRVTPRDLD